MHKTILAALLLYSLQSLSQTIPSTGTPFTLNMGGGSAAVTPTIMVDWSIGESTITETFYGENAFSNLIMGTQWNVTSGVLQPFDKTNIIYNYLIPMLSIQEIRFYPIPTPNIVNIDFRSALKGKVSIQLLNQEGKLLGQKDFTQISQNSIQSWDLSNRPNGIYYFHILLLSAQGNILKQGTFKVEKNK